MPSVQQQAAIFQNILKTRCQKVTKSGPRRGESVFCDRDSQCLTTVSEFRELSPNSQVETECSEATWKNQHTKPVCSDEPSEYLQDSLKGVGNNVSVPSFSWFKSMSQIVG